MLLALHAAMPPVPSKHLYGGGGGNGLGGGRGGGAGGGHAHLRTEELLPNTPVKLLYSAVFLDPGSRRALSAAHPPRHPNVSCDHVTLRYMPTEAQLRGAGVGTTVTLTVNGVYADHRVHAVRVALDAGFSAATAMDDDRTPHVTIATAPGVPPSDVRKVSDWTAVDPPLQLAGVVGVRVVEVGNELALLPVKIQKKIKDFVDLAQPGEHLKFRDVELSSAERRIVHGFAGDSPLVDSESSGPKGKRRLTLTKRRPVAGCGGAGADDARVVAHAALLDDDAAASKHKKHHSRPSASKQQHTIKDPFLFATLNVDTENEAVRTDGQLTPAGVLGTDLSSCRRTTLFVLRGLQGSGKSTLARFLASVMEDAVVVSADQFFEGKDGTYAFDADKLQEAHAACFRWVEGGG